MSERSQRYSFSSAFSAVSVGLLLGVAACGGGGGGGGGGAGEFQIQEEASYLILDQGDLRTGLRLRFLLSDLANPDEPLTEADFEVRIDGAVDVEANVDVNSADLTKSDITMVLDVSSSLSPTDLDNLKTSAQEFAQEVVGIAGRLRIFSFSSVTRTMLVGEYEATDDGSGGFEWTPDPSDDIEAMETGASSTALFNAVVEALRDNTDPSNILVVFSDGKENSSPQGKRAEALSILKSTANGEKNGGMIVFTVGFGSVDSSELRALVVGPGKFVGVRPSLVGLFTEVARQIKSIYTVVYDTPVAFGTQNIEVRIDTGSRIVRHTTQFEAGVDLARDAYGVYPAMPGSMLELSDLTKDPVETLTYTVLPVSSGMATEDGVFVFGIEPTHDCPGVDCVPLYQGPLGEGSQDEDGDLYFGAVADIGAEWKDSGSALEDATFMLAGFETLTFLRGTADRLTLRCARVTNEDGTRWFAPGVGLVRMHNLDGDPVLELASPPCLTETLEGGACSTQ